LKLMALLMHVPYEFSWSWSKRAILPPIQISVVDVKNWQKRSENNDLEVNQIQVSSLIVLTHIENVSIERKKYCN